MTRIRRISAIGTALVLLAMATRPCTGQGAFECPTDSICWIAGTGSYNDDANWEGGLVPDFFQGENAAIVNGGTAIVDDTPIEPLNLYLGRTAFNGIGTLEIRSGGKLFVGDGLGGGGLVHVGGSQFNTANGVGHLAVLRGGELEAETLTSGGDRSSSLVLGQTDGSGTAKATVLGTSTLARNTRIVGPNVEFATEFLVLASEHVLTGEITGRDHSTISVTEDATLNGSTLHVQFSGYTPAFGDAWSILDAFTIDGQFGQVTAAGLPAGAGVFVSYTAGGQGSLARLTVGTQLALSIDRRTGQTVIENRAAAEAVDIDDYLIFGIEGASPFDPALWASIHDQGGAGWVESVATSAQLGETNAAGSRVLSPESSIDLGAPYSFTPSAIGEVAPQVSFEYNLEGGGTVPGRVDFTGPHNNVVLLVDPATGGAAMQNQSVFDIDVDGYLITSLSGSLDPEAWLSLQDSGQADWGEANPSAVHLAELNLNSSLSLDANGALIGIGSPFDFDAEGALRDLAFEFHLARGGTIQGIVEYGSLDIINPLDCNGDGVLDAADLNCACASGIKDDVLAELRLLDGDFDGNGDVAFADFLVLSANFGQAVDGYAQGDIDCDGTVAFADFLILSANFGQSAASAASVPEPSGWSLAGLSLCGLLWRRSRRQPVVPSGSGKKPPQPRRATLIQAESMEARIASKGILRKSVCLWSPSRARRASMFGKHSARGTSELAQRAGLGFAFVSLALLIVGPLANSGSAQTLTPAKQVFVSDSSDRDMINANMDPGPLDDDGNIVARERQDQTQDNIQIRTFIEFDLSSITPEQVANPGFDATLLIDFVTRLNTVNDMTVVVGRVLGRSDPGNSDGALGDSWTTEPGSLPLFEWGRTTGESTAPDLEEDRIVVVENVRTDPLGTREADVSAIVANWVNGVRANNGFSVAGGHDEFQGAGLNNARLVVGIPGDFDGNGTVDTGDFLILAANFAGHLDGPVANGDMDFDGDIDLDDFGLFKGVFSAQNQAQAVPEPSSMLGFAAWGIVGRYLIRGRRRRKS